MKRIKGCPDVLVVGMRSHAKLEKRGWMLTEEGHHRW